MAMNLRLRPDAAEALREESERTGVSQQEILRRAVDEHLGLTPRPVPATLPDWVIPADEPFRIRRPWLTLPPGVTVVDLIDREDRL
jgi:hypothetical protein